MGYGSKTKITPAMERERDFLLAGLSYAEVAERTRMKIGSIKERNRLIYSVDIRDAYGKRVEREGIKSRYASGDAFGWWFTGYFDGEGCLTVFYRERGKYAERRVGVQISCRDDDAGVLALIHRELGGVMWNTEARGSTRPTCNWRIESAADLAQVIIPMFDTYPLRSKKRHEYALWRQLALKQYVNTLGGTSTRVGATEKENAAFQKSMHDIRKIRRG